MELNRTVIEAASWRLASELARRHPTEIRIVRGHPGGGQYDVLWLRRLGEGNQVDPGNVPLNRNGTIQIHGRFDGEPVGDWESTRWDEYLSADPLEFLLRLEAAAGLRPPATTPSSTPATLTYRVLAAIAATAVMSVHPIDIQPGFIDASDWCGPNSKLDAFPIDSARLVPGPNDLYGEPRYRFWIVVRGDQPLIAIDQADATAWSAISSEPFNLVDLYQASGRDVAVVAGKVLRRGIVA